MLHSFCLKTSSEPAPVTKQKLLGQISATLSSHSYSRFHPGILTGPMFDMWQDLLIDLVPLRRKKVQTKTVTPSSRQGLKEIVHDFLVVTPAVHPDCRGPMLGRKIQSAPSLTKSTVPAEDKVEMLQYITLHTSKVLVVQTLSVMA